MAGRRGTGWIAGRVLAAVALCVTALPTGGDALAAGSVPAVAVPTAAVGPTQTYRPGRTTVRSVEAEIHFESVVTSGGTACWTAVWAIVDDLDDAAFFTVIFNRSDAPGSDYPFTFNRHERGSAIESSYLFPDIAVPEGKIAGLWQTGGGDGPGNGAADCASMQASYPERFSIESATVTRFEVVPPTRNQAGYEVLTKPVGPANNGPDGLDGCANYFFISVPKRPGAISYTVNVSYKTSGKDRVVSHTLAPKDFNPRTPDGSGVGSYRTPGRLGHYLGTDTETTWGCTYHLKRWLDSDRLPSISKVTFSVQYPKCFGKLPTIVATGKVTNGTPGDDVILGSKRADVIDGKGGDDRICGLGRNDTLRGGPGNDLLDGGPGTDSCAGGPGRNRLVRCEPR